MIDAKAGLGAKRFLADYFGFDIRLLRICGIKMNKDGCYRVIQFKVNAPALNEPAEYISAYHEEMEDWELIRLPQ